MEKYPMCRICLIQNVPLYEVVDKNLQDVYEKLTGIRFITEDRRPMHACFICCGKLEKCLRLLTKFPGPKIRFAQMSNEEYKPKPLLNQQHLQFCSGQTRSSTENTVAKQLPAVCGGIDDINEPEEEEFVFIEPYNEQDDIIEPKKEQGDIMEPKKEQGNIIQLENEQDDIIEPKNEQGDIIEQDKELDDIIEEKEEIDDSIEPKENDRIIFYDGEILDLSDTEDAIDDALDRIDDDIVAMEVEAGFLEGYDARIVYLNERNTG